MTLKERCPNFHVLGMRLPGVASFTFRQKSSIKGRTRRPSSSMSDSRTKAEYQKMNDAIDYCIAVSRSLEEKEHDDVAGHNVRVVIVDCNLK